MISLSKDGGEKRIVVTTVMPDGSRKTANKGPELIF